MCVGPHTGCYFDLKRVSVTSLKKYQLCLLTQSTLARNNNNSKIGKNRLMQKSHDGDDTLQSVVRTFNVLCTHAFVVRTLKHNNRIMYVSVMRTLQYRTSVVRTFNILCIHVFVVRTLKHSIHVICMYLS